MVKIATRLLILLMIFSLCAPTLAEQTRNPQGRLGLQYKTEPYNPTYNSNISNEELELLGKKIEQFEQEQKRNEKIAKNNAEKEKIAQLKLQKKQKQLARKEALAGIKAEKKAKKQEEKITLEAKNGDSKSDERTKNFFANLANKKEEKNIQKAEEITTTQPQKVAEAVQAIKASQEPKHQDYETQKIIEEITKELTNERPKMLEELSALWVSAVQKSDTVYFAIMKLSNPNGEEVNKKGIKKILEPILGAAPLVGQAFVNPALTAGSLIGSNVLGTMMNDNATKRLTKVNDADLVILARAIDELQETLLMNYMAYKSAYTEYELSIKITEERKKAYDELNKQNSPYLVLANTFYTEALDSQYKARQHFLMKRVILEQMVGAEALNEIEQKESTASISQ